MQYTSNSNILIPLFSARIGFPARHSMTIAASDVSVTGVIVLAGVAWAGWEAGIAVQAVTAFRHAYTPQSTISRIFLRAKEMCV